MVMLDVQAATLGSPCLALDHVCRIHVGVRMDLQRLAHCVAQMELHRVQAAMQGIIFWELTVCRTSVHARMVLVLVVLAVHTRAQPIRSRSVDHVWKDTT